MSRVVYTYCESTDTHGDLGDLKTATRQNYVDGQWVDESTHYYRYYRSGAENGCTHGLKSVLGPAAYTRLCDDPAVSDPFTASDVKVAEYADNYFEYDAARRAVKETVNGGEQTSTFAYTTNTAPNGQNEWRRKTVETRSDGSKVTVYTSYANKRLLKQIESSGGQDVSIEYWQYNDDGREILHATSAAVAGYVDDGGENEDSLVVTLEQSDGKIELSEYYTTGPVGYLKNRKIKQGSSGTPIVLAEYEYTERSVDGQYVYDPSKVTTYRNDNGTGAIETYYSYELDSGKIVARTTTLPAVQVSQNGSGTSAVRIERFDAFGNLAWVKDERGYIAHHEYDVVLGTLIRTIQDVDDAQLTVPSGWSTPAGGGKHLVTDYEIDIRGRTTQILGPEHDVNQQTVRTATWTVYDDANHEVRSAQGYLVTAISGGSSSSSSSTASEEEPFLVNPVTIHKSDADGKALEEIQAVRASTTGKLSVSDTFAQSSYTRWTTHHYNAYGQETATRVYHTIPATGAGSSGTNYDETTSGYDSRGRLTKMTYADGRELNYDYGSAGSTDDALSRVASLIDDDGSTHLVDYSYLGRNTFVKSDYPEPDLRYDLAKGAGDDPYDGFDRFGRVVDSRWYDYGSSSDVDRILYGYDRASKRTYREQTCDPNSYHDEVYGYDGVNRLTDFDRGTINGNKDAIATLTFAQQWSLDPTGNWSGFKEDDDGDSSWDLDQSRTSNKVNEITDPVYET